MKIRHNLILVWIVVLAALITGCKTLYKTSLQNVVFLYQPENQFAELNSCVFHSSDSISTLYVKVYFNDLLYQKDPFTGLYTCSYSLSYKLKGGYESKDILQTASVVSGDSLNYGKSKSVIHSFEIKAAYPEKYLLEIVLYDMKRNAGTTGYLEVDKSSRQGRQNFLVMDLNQELVFKNYMPAGEPFRIICNRHDLMQLFANKYTRDFPVARPPYTEDREPQFDYIPDSVFTVNLFNGESGWITLESEGFCHFRQDTVSREGFTLFCFLDGYPDITSAEQLQAPLRYITTRKEFDTLTESGNIKAAVDEFWLKTARTPERAQILFQKYYTGVENANKYFTSYLEGWKSDRGLIYIIFGIPDFVYHGDGFEDWTYGEPQNRSSLQFTFVRVNNPFTDNDYMLLRSPTFKEPWFVTVQSWRR